jgi:CRP-like cAMP-binding protein
MDSPSTRPLAFVGPCSGTATDTAGAPPWDAARRAALLRSVALFGTLPVPLLERIAAHFQPRRFARGEFVFFEGEASTSLNVLAEGRVKVVRETEEGQEVILRLIAPGELFGAAGGWGEAVYPATARAQEDAVVLQVPADCFEQLMATEPPLAHAVVRDLSSRLREAEDRIRALQTERVERRLARALLRLARKTQARALARGAPARGAPDLTLTRQELADLAGTTLFTASRTLSAWDQRGIVAAGRERVTLVAPSRLREIAEDSDEVGEDADEGAGDAGAQSRAAG